MFSTLSVEETTELAQGDLAGEQQIRNSRPEQSDFGARVPANSLSHSAVTCWRGHGRKATAPSRSSSSSRGLWGETPGPVCPPVEPLTVQRPCPWPDGFPLHRSPRFNLPPLPGWLSLRRPAGIVPSSEASVSKARVLPAPRVPLLLTRPGFPRWQSRAAKSTEKVSGGPTPRRLVPVTP